MQSNTELQSQNKKNFTLRIYRADSYRRHWVAERMKGKIKCNILVRPGTTSHRLHAGSTVPDADSSPLHFCLQIEILKGRQLHLFQAQEFNKLLTFS